MSANTLVAEKDQMGRVVAEVMVENLKDLWDAERDIRKPEDVRRVVVTDALVDSGATTLALPSKLIRELGLSKVREQNAVSVRGRGTIQIYEAVRLTILGRNCVVEVMEVPDDVPALIGQIPLEMLDLVIDLQGRKLTGNPAHDGEHVLELLIAETISADTLEWTACKMGNSIGLRVPVCDRTNHFDRSWQSVVLVFPPNSGIDDVEVNVAKKSFWSSRCREVISMKIKNWLEAIKSYPWEKPPSAEGTC